MKHRYLPKVIDQMIALVPNDGSENVLIDALQNAKSSAEYSAPENIAMHWERTAHVLMDSFGIKEELFSDWQKRIINIWMNYKVFEV